MSKELRAALTAIWEGHEFTIDETGEHNLVIVENPNFQEDNGENPFLVFEVIKEEK